MTKKKRKTLGTTDYPETEVVNFKVPEKLIDAVRVTAVQYGAKLTLLCFAPGRTDTTHTVVFEKRINAHNGGVSYAVSVDDSVWYSTGGALATDEDNSYIRAFNEAWGYYQSWSDKEDRTVRTKAHDQGLEAAAELFGQGGA